MRQVLFWAAFVALLAACEAHVTGPENVILIPEGEPVVVTLAGGESHEGELLEVTATYLLLKEQGHYVTVDLSIVSRVLVKRYGLSVDSSLSEELPPYSRYPQGLTTEQREYLLETSEQKGFFKLPLNDMNGEKLRTAEKKTAHAAVAAGKESRSLHPSDNGTDGDSQISFFDSRTGMNWIIMPASIANLDTANSICGSLETGDRRKYRVPSLREFKELWKRYKNDERISIFKNQEYSTMSGEISLKSGDQRTTFSFATGNPGWLYAAHLACVSP